MVCVTLPLLISRLEQAQEGSAELDLEVAKLFAPEHLRPPAHAYHSGYCPESGSPEWETKRWRAYIDRQEEHTREERYAELDAINDEEAGGMGWFERYTQSLDAARLLAPAGWHVSHAHWGRERSAFCLTREAGVYAEGRSSPEQPALALVIAALRARMLAEGGGDVR